MLLLCQQTFNKVARRGITGLMGKMPGITPDSGITAKITGMTPQQAAQDHVDSLEKLLKFVSSLLLDFSFDKPFFIYCYSKIKVEKFFFY